MLAKLQARQEHEARRGTKRAEEPPRRRARRRAFHLGPRCSPVAAPLLIPRRDRFGLARMQPAEVFEDRPILGVIERVPDQRIAGRAARRSLCTQIKNDRAVRLHCRLSNTLGLGARRIRHPICAPRSTGSNQDSETDAHR
jgi:hypothetical protein